MKYPNLIAVCLCAALPFAAQAAFFDDDAPAGVAANTASFETAFSPAEPLSANLVRTIASAKKSIYVVARDFTSKPLSEALVKASRTGVDVKILLNKKTNQNIYSASKFLLTMSLVPHLTKTDDTLYSNYIVIDERDVILGNVGAFLDETEEKKNRANMLIIKNVPDLAKRYMNDWQSAWNDSEAMKPEKN